MEKLLKVAVVLSAYDRMTRVINDATNNGIKKFSELKKQADRVSSSAFSFARDTAAIGLAVAAPIVMATREAIKFEDKMADVAKVMNLAAGSSELAAQADAAKELAVYLAQTPEDAAELMANLAQGGVAANELSKVAKIAGEVGVAFGMSAGEAGESFIKMRNALGVSIDEAKKVTDAMNHLGNSTASASDELFTFMAAGGAGVARALGLGGQEAAAFGSVLISVGKSASEAGTIMERFMKGIMSNSEFKSMFDKAGGGLAGVMAVLQKGASLDPNKQFAFFQKFGQYGTDIRLMAQNMGLLQNTLGLVSDEALYADSAMAEFQNRQATTATQLQKLQTQTQVLAIDLGNALLPVLNDLVQQAIPVVNNIIAWIKANPELTGTIMKAAAGVAAFSLAISGISFVVGSVAKVVSVASTAFTFFTKALGFVRLAMVALRVVFLTNPIGLIATGIAVAAYLIITHWGKIKEFFVGLWNGVKAAFDKGFVNGILHVIKIFNPLYWFHKAITALIKWLLGVDLSEAGRKIINSVVDGMKAMASKPVEAIKNIVKKIRDFLPFSPAKEGPLRDIHRIRLVETIAEGMKPDAAVRAMRRVTQSVFNVSPVGAPAIAGVSYGGGGGTVTLNYSPVVNINGGAAPGAGESIIAQLRQYQPELLRMIEDAIARRERTKF